MKRKGFNDSISKPNSQEVVGVSEVIGTKSKDHGTKPMDKSKEHGTKSHDNTSAKEVGNQSLDHYKALPPYRFRLRNWLLPLIRKETDALYKIQNSLRSPILDYYFAWTANLASHTFYVLILPISNWFGSATLARDLIFVLGFGIYITGNLKDFLCLPRPRSPPLHRITMSSYTTQEYGFPSSHSANATAVTLIMSRKLLEMDIQTSTKVICMIIVVIYYVSLIFGRVYCGMHGFFDIITGSLVGLALFLFRAFWGKAWDDFLILDNNFGTYGTPIVILAFYLSLIHIHFEPIDDCPCFDDSVAFIGVLIGLDLSHWMANITRFFLKLGHDQTVSPIIIEYDFSRLGFVKSVLRAVLGITLVVIWHVISKPVVFTILPPIYKTIGIYLPRRNYTSTAFSKNSNAKIRRTSISNMKDEFMLGGKQDDKVGIESDIDYYEMINYHDNLAPRLAKVFKARYDVEIIGRLIVYAGVSTVTVWGFALGTYYLNLV